jgi:hypothetical protein
MGLAYQLNEFVSAAKKVINYLQREPGRPKEFQKWLDAEWKKFRQNRRGEFFLALRDQSDKDQIVYPVIRGSYTNVVGTVDLSKEPLARTDPSGSIKIHRREGSAINHIINVYERRPLYYVDGWPDEDIMSFLREVVVIIQDCVMRAYEEFRHQHRKCWQLLCGMNWIWEVED